MKRNAYTLVELVLAMFITALIALTTAGVAGALSYSYNHTQNMTETLQSQRYVMGSIEKVIRTAKLVTATTTSGMIVWAGDANSNKAIDLNELVKIDFDSANHQVVQESLPTVSGALNATLTLATANVFNTVKTQMDSAGLANYRVSRVLATNVRDFQVRADVAAPRTTVVLIRMTAGEDDQAVTVTDSIHLRADNTSAVSVSNGVPYLSLP